MAVSLLIAVLSIWTIVTQSKTFSFAELVEDIRNCNIIWLILALACSLGFIFCEGAALCTIIKELFPQQFKHREMLYAGADIYFSAITPSATGGQPATAYFLIKDGIPASGATVILMVNLIMYTFSLMLTGFVCVFFNVSIFVNLSFLAKLMIIIGFALMTLVTVFFALLLWNETLLDTITKGIYNLLVKLHIIKHGDKIKGKYEKTVNEYRECADVLYGKKKMIGKIFLWNLAQRLCHIFVTVFCYLATEGTFKYLWDVCVVQGLTDVGSNCIPIPGAIGAADYLLIEGLDLIPNVEKAANLELLSRGLAFYICVVLCFIITAVGYLMIRRREKKC